MSDLLGRNPWMNWGEGAIEEITKRLDRIADELKRGNDIRRDAALLAQADLKYTRASMENDDINRCVRLNEELDEVLDRLLADVSSTLKR